MCKLPRKAQILGIIYDVVVKKDITDSLGRACDGLIEFENRVIYISSSLTQKEAEQAFGHEIIHGTLLRLGLTLNDDLEEILSDSISNVFVENGFHIEDDEVVDKNIKPKIKRKR